MRKMIALPLLLLTSVCFAGTEGGGGGDATELRVNEIRSDILSWIQKGGAKGLKFDEELDVTYEFYVEQMSEFLRPNKVAVSFTEEKVYVDHVEKTCRGQFVNDRPEMKCNISRFSNTSNSEQYKLIHHEYAGLARVEKNVGASSDYTLSRQVTDFLKKEAVLRLSIKNQKEMKCGIIVPNSDLENVPSYIIEEIKKSKLKLIQKEPTVAELRTYYQLRTFNESKLVKSTRKFRAHLHPELAHKLIEVDYTVTKIGISKKEWVNELGSVTVGSYGETMEKVPYLHRNNEWIFATPDIAYKTVKYERSKTTDYFFEDTIIKNFREILEEAESECTDVE